jgi:predicted alpha-1,2-mannosidase
MKKYILGIAAAGAAIAAITATSCAESAASEATGKDYADLVNPLMGSQSTFELSTGNTYPAIARPWGMNFWTPQTGPMGDGWQYQYTANKIRGFKQTHQPSPWINDYGQFSIMPVTGAPLFREDERQSWFSHKGEVAKPYYYKAYLADFDVVTEITPTERAAMFRFTFPANDSSFVVIDAFDRGSYVKVLPEQNKVIGYTTRNSGGVPDNFRNYFVMEFDKPFEYTSTFSNDRKPENQDQRLAAKDYSLKTDVLEQEGWHTGAVVGFKTSKGEQVIARVASSFISPEQAERNLKELGNDDFDTLVSKGRDAWNDILGRIDVEGGNLDQERTFYSCLYRSTLFPRKFYEIDAEGKPVHYSPYNGQVLPGYMYTDTGLWDTFRSLFPLLNLAYPSVNHEIQEGMLNAYRESGFFPEWASPGHRGCMVGNNSASVLADAYLKGVKVEDTETLWEGIVKGTENVHPEVSSTGRLGHEYYNKLGYVPYDVDIKENAARTLEYAYDDWTIYQLAKALNRPQEEQDLYAKRAMNYRNLFDKETNLMRGRNADGSFATPFSPLKWGDAFTEGNSWHYTWSVFHDPQGLIDLMGGKETFVAMMDSVFSVPPIFDDSYYGFPIHEIREMQVMNMGNYAHGNQPIQHMIYLYDWAGEPWKAQYWVRDVMDRMYTPTPDGYCGDEDNGQTSAWYVFSAMGFYPVAPGTDEYALGSPLFKKVTINLENGNKMVIEAPDNDASKRYVESMKLNGKSYDKNYIKHGELLEGGTISFDMSDKPNTSRGTDESAFPYSFSKEMK